MCSNPTQFHADINTKTQALLTALCDLMEEHLHSPYGCEEEKLLHTIALIPVVMKIRDFDQFRTQQVMDKEKQSEYIRQSVSTMRNLAERLGLDLDKDLEKESIVPHDWAQQAMEEYEEEK